MSPPSLNRALPLLPVPASVFEAAAPVVSVYINTEGAFADAAERVARRWTSLRRSLVDDGAPEAALAAVESFIADAHAEGETLVVIANADGALYSAHLPELPDADLATVRPLPHLVPLIAARQRMLPHLVVATDRVGAEIVAVLPEAPDEHREVTGNDFHITRSAPGGYSQRRFQQRAENRWEANARDVADELVRLTETTDPRLIVVSGDVRAVAFLRDHLPDRVTDLLVEVQGDYSALDEALRRSRDLVADLADQDIATAVAAFEPGDDEVEQRVSGAAETLEALDRGQVATVVLDPLQATGEIAWSATPPSRSGSTAENLEADGVTDPTLVQLVDVLVRAAAATAAAVVIAPAAAPLAPSGVGGLLRY